MISDWPLCLSLVCPPSATSPQRSSTESLACPCLPLTALPSGKRTNLRNRSGCFEKKIKSPGLSDPMLVYCQQCPFKHRQKHRKTYWPLTGSQWKRNWLKWKYPSPGYQASCSWCVLGLGSQLTKMGKLEEGELERQHEDLMSSRWATLVLKHTCWEVDCFSFSCQQMAACSLILKVTEPRSWGTSSYHTEGLLQGLETNKLPAEKNRLTGYWSQTLSWVDHKLTLFTHSVFIMCSFWKPKVFFLFITGVCLILIFDSISVFSSFLWREKTV